MDDDLFSYKESVPKTNKFCFKKVKESAGKCSQKHAGLNKSKTVEVFKPSLPQTTICDTSTITLNSRYESNENEDLLDNDLSQQSIDNVLLTAEENAIKYLKCESNQSSTGNLFWNKLFNTKTCVYVEQ